MERIHYILIPTSSWFKMEVVDGAHHMMILLIPEYILCALSSLSSNVIIPIMIKRTCMKIFSSAQNQNKYGITYIYQGDTYTLVLLDSLINEHSWSNQTKGLCTFFKFLWCIGDKYSFIYIVLKEVSCATPMPAIDDNVFELRREH